MGPKLKVSAGPSRSQLQVVATNYDESSPLKISSDEFEGSLTVRIRDFHGELAEGKQVRESTESDYFQKHTGLTWSMAIQGRFKHDINGDDIVYGNQFDKPIRDHLPYGTSAALKFVSYVDPALEQDIYSDKPWAFSPLLATMNHLAVQRLASADAKAPGWSSAQPEDDVTSLYSDTSDIEHLKGNANARRSWYANKGHRQNVTITNRDYVNMDFCNGYLDFNTFSLKIPGGLSFSLLKYWDGQPVTYVCKSRDSKREFFYIVFDIVDEHAIAHKGSGGQVKDREAETAQHKEALSVQQEDDLGVD